MAASRGFNKHRRPTKRVGYFALLFPQKEAINGVNKRYIIKPTLKRTLIMMSFQGQLACYALVTSEVLRVTQTLLFQSIFPRFFVDLRRICL